MNDLGLFKLCLDDNSGKYQFSESSFAEAIEKAEAWAQEEKTDVEIFEFQCGSVYLKTVYYDDNQTG
jgi:hypothetical protein